MKKNTGYKQWLTDLKSRIRQSQIKAAVKVNTELLRLYWDMGRDIVTRRMETSWGNGFFKQLSQDLLLDFPDMKGFSTSNLYYIRQFYQFYTQGSSNFQQVVGELPHQLGAELQPVANQGDIILHQVGEEFEDHPIFQVPWGHHIQIFTKCKSIKEALFYVRKTIENGWSRAVLMNFMEAGLYAAQGKSQNNFKRLLPEPQSDLANQILKDLTHTSIGQRPIRTSIAGLNTPKGFPLIARGCAYPRYPGYVTDEKHNPKGVASHDNHATHEATPLGLKSFFEHLPGVARVRATPGCKKKPLWGFSQCRASGTMNF